jgi:hypothetical protein
MPRRTPTYRPHVVLACENMRPSSVWMFAMLSGPDKLLHLDLDLRLPSQTYMRQAMNLLPKTVPCFGKVVAFTVNYRNDFAVKYSGQGEVLEVLDHAVTHGFGPVTLTTPDPEAQEWIDSYVAPIDISNLGTVH